MEPKISLIVGCYNMAREFPRTIRSLSPSLQKGLQNLDYEIIVVDNGSTAPFDEAACREWVPDLQILRFPPGDPSPVRALNAGIQKARGELVGMLIDGARLASPGLVAFATKAAAMVDRTVVATLGFHLGPDVQSRSILQGYNQDEEDRLLAQSGWTDDGYRLFDISALAASSAGGWFGPIAESNALFMRRELWSELGGLDENFRSPGGGIANLDLFCRAVELPGTSVVTLLGEGTFHQIHGGVATNAVKPIIREFFEEFSAIRGRPYQFPKYRSLYLGSMPNGARKSIDPEEGKARTIFGMRWPWRMFKSRHAGSHES